MSEYHNLQNALFDRKVKFDSEVVLNNKLSQELKDELWDDLLTELAAKAHRLCLLESGMAFNKVLLDVHESDNRPVLRRFVG